MAGFTFVCYAREDREFAHRLIDDLKGRGADLWSDRDIPAGADWDAEIDRALEDCARFTMVLTPTSVDKDEPRAELRVALDRKIPIIPVLYKQCPRLPRQLRNIQYADFTDKGPGRDPALQQLAIALGVKETPAKKPAAPSKGETRRPKVRLQPPSLIRPPDQQLLDGIHKRQAERLFSSLSERRAQPPPFHKRVGFWISLAVLPVLSIGSLIAVDLGANWLLGRWLEMPDLPYRSAAVLIIGLIWAVAYIIAGVQEADLEGGWTFVLSPFVLWNFVDAHELLVAWPVNFIWTWGLSLAAAAFAAGQWGIPAGWVFYPALTVLTVIGVGVYSDSV